MRFTRCSLMMRPTRICRENESWREAGVSYLRYLNVCTATTHKCMKEGKQKDKYSRFSSVNWQAMQFSSASQLLEPAEIKGVPSKLEDYHKGASTTKAE